MARAKSEALALFDRAVKLAPDNVAVHYQIGLSLAGFDSEKYQSPHRRRIQGRGGQPAPHRL